MNRTTGESLLRADLWKLGLGCLALTVALYYPALHFGFVADDVSFLHYQPHWFRDAVVPAGTFHYIPLTQITLYGLAGLSGWRPAVMHALNLLVHAGIGVGLALWLNRMGAGRGACLLAALLFVTRGVSYEVVGWITELVYLAVVVYTLLSFNWWDKYLRGEGTRYLAVTVAAFTAAVLTIEHALVLLPLYFFFEALVRPERSILSHLPMPANRSPGWWRPYGLRLLKDVRRYVPFVLVIVAFVGVKVGSRSPLTWSGQVSATARAPVPSGTDLIYRLPPDRTVLGMFNSPRRACLDLLVSTSYLFFPTVGCFGGVDTWMTRQAWLLLPWLLVNLWVAWKGPGLVRFLLVWVYIYTLPLVLASVPQARYYYMATLPAAALSALAVIGGWKWLLRRAPSSVLLVVAWIVLAAMVYGEAVFIRARLMEWKLASDLTTKTLTMLGQDLNGPGDEVYLINFPQTVPSRYFPPYAFDFARVLHLMVRPPRERGTVRPVYDRSFVDGKWPTVGEYASLAELREKLRQPGRIAYRFVGHPPWIIRWH